MGIVVVFFFGSDLSVQRCHPNDLAQPLQTFVEVGRAHDLCGVGALCVLFDAERGQVSRDRTLEMPRRHDVLLPLGRGLLVSLSADGLLVLVGGQHDADAIFLASLARRAGHFQALARFAASFLCSGIQREVLGDILRYLKAVGYMVHEGKGQNDGCLLA
jgi:hypothetical protein